ncbi:MAG: DUF411 domain-containing protein [Minwuia sp.]|nr:DUF411 domain-containing protein [Minwuia sp.]
MRRLLSLVLATLLISAAFPAFAKDHSVEATLFKNPQCGCCENYATYLRENGFTVVVKPTHELAQMSRMAGIPEEFQGCHISMIDGYVVSGHVPVASILRLLNDQPKIVGITLPGMPQGSPGMSGIKSGPFTIFEIGSPSPQVYEID